MIETTVYPYPLPLVSSPEVTTIFNLVFIIVCMLLYFYITRFCIAFPVLNITYSREADMTEKRLMGLEITNILFLKLDS